MVAMAEFPSRRIANFRRSPGRRRGFGSKIPDYILGSYIDEVLCMIKADNTRYFFSTNDLYSVYALTDSTGNVVERYMFDPYGKVTVLDQLGNPLTSNQSTVGNPWTFTGRRLDGETGLMYYRNRMYETGLGRFVSRDPIGGSRTTPMPGDGYVDGFSFYHAPFVPSTTDAHGLQQGAYADLVLVPVPIRRHGTVEYNYPTGEKRPTATIDEERSTILGLLESSSLGALGPVLNYFGAGTAYAKDGGVEKTEKYEFKKHSVKVSGWTQFRAAAGYNPQLSVEITYGYNVQNRCCRTGIVLVKEKHWVSHKQYGRLTTSDLFPIFYVPVGESKPIPGFTKHERGTVSINFSWLHTAALPVFISASGTSEVEIECGE